MCSVSMVSDWYNQDWRLKQPTYPAIPNLLPTIAPATLPWSDESLKLLKEIMGQLKKLDDKLGLPDCEDPNKAKWIKSIEKKVQRKKSKRM